MLRFWTYRNSGTLNGNREVRGKSWFWVVVSGRGTNVGFRHMHVSCYLQKLILWLIFLIHENVSEFSYSCLNESGLFFILIVNPWTLPFSGGIFRLLGKTSCFLHFNPGKILYAQQIKVSSLPQGIPLELSPSTWEASQMSRQRRLFEDGACHWW